MKAMIRFTTYLILAAGFNLSALADQPFNPSFEDGTNYVGWRTNDASRTRVVNDSPGLGYGTQSIELTGGGPIYPNPSVLIYDTSVQSQPFAMNAGETLFGAARFFNNEPSDFQGTQYAETAAVSIINGFLGGFTVYHVDSNSSPSDTGWTFFQVTVPITGTYYLILDNSTLVDQLYPGVLRVDFPEPVSAVPEPETYAMLIAGLGLLGFAARRRKQKEADAA